MSGRGARAPICARCKHPADGLILGWESVRT